jgi:putative ABC transport system substrate-binding protein
MLLPEWGLACGGGNFSVFWVVSRRHAARGARAASRAQAAHWHADEPSSGRPGFSSPQRGVPAEAGRTGLDCRPRNVQVEYRWAAGDAERIRRYATELAALTPDVILATGGFGVTPLRQTTRTVPIVFVNITDAVGQGLVESLARPGGNATGFILLEYAASGKWLELLKQIAPHVTRIAVVRELSTASGSGQFGAIQAAAAALGVEISSIDVSDPAEIERNVTAFGRASNGGLIVTASALAAVHRGLIITLAARHRLPAVYFSRLFPGSGGLSSYGPDPIDQYRHAAGYVDRILRVAADEVIE